MPSAISVGPGSASAFSSALGFPSPSSALFEDEPIADSIFSFAKTPEGLHPIVHAESKSAPRTPEALAAMLHAWVDATLEPLRGTLRHELVGNALRKYVVSTLLFAAQAGVSHAVNYHRAVMEAGCHSPPLYDPITMGPVAKIEHLLHIQPYIGKSGAGRSRFPGKRPRQSPEPKSPPSGQSSGNQPRGPKRQRGGSQAGGADHCTIHPNAGHTNAQCYQQQGSQPGGRRSGGAPAATSPAAPRDASER
jgi:hypothetical protein